jgi:hypothetical protein
LVSNLFTQSFTASQVQADNKMKVCQLLGLTVCF